MQSSNMNNVDIKIIKDPDQLEDYFTINDVGNKTVKQGYFEQNKRNIEEKGIYNMAHLFPECITDDYSKFWSFPQLKLSCDKE